MNKTVITAIIVAVIFGGGGFYGGMQYAKSSTTSKHQGRNFAAMRGVRGGSSGPNSNASFIAGQITAKNGNSLTVQSRDGSSKIVILSGSTAIAKSVSGSASDLAAGQNVMITGTTNSDGSVTAENIQIRPSTPNSQRAGSGSTNTNPGN